MRVRAAARGDDRVDPRWGRFCRLALADIDYGAIAGWAAYEIAWDCPHGVGGEGARHACVARFPRQHPIDTVVAGHVGTGRARMRRTTGITAPPGARGDARYGVTVAAATGEPHTSDEQAASR